MLIVAREVGTILRIGDTIISILEIVGDEVRFSIQAAQ